jgi:ABC-type sugar transport system substrate-binding protein
MNALEKNIAVARGEALAASLLASAALQAVFMFVPPQDRGQFVSGLNAFVDDALNRAGPPNVDANDDEPNTLMRETARFQAMQHLDAMARMFKDPPAGN